MGSRPSIALRVQAEQIQTEIPVPTVKTHITIRPLCYFVGDHKNVLISINISVVNEGDRCILYYENLIDVDRDIWSKNSYDISDWLWEKSQESLTLWGLTFTKFVLEE